MPRGATRRATVPLPRLPPWRDRRPGSRPRGRSEVGDSIGSSRVGHRGRKVTGRGRAMADLHDRKVGQASRRALEQEGGRAAPRTRRRSRGPAAHDDDGGWGVGRTATTGPCAGRAQQGRSGGRRSRVGGALPARPIGRRRHGPDAQAPDADLAARDGAPRHVAGREVSGGPSAAATRAAECRPRVPGQAARWAYLPNSSRSSHPRACSFAPRPLPNASMWCAIQSSRRTGGDPVTRSTVSVTTSAPPRFQAR